MLLKNYLVIVIQFGKSNLHVICNVDMWNYLMGRGEKNHAGRMGGEKKSRGNLIGGERNSTILIP